MKPIRAPYANLVGVYKKSKFLGERVAREAAAAGQDVVIVNPSTPIGPWDVKPTPTGEIVLRFARGAMPAYVDTGLNLIDVRDCAAGHRLAYERGVAGERYILGNLNLALREIFVRLAKITSAPFLAFAFPSAVPLAVRGDRRVLARALGLHARCRSGERSDGKGADVL